MDFSVIGEAAIGAFTPFIEKVATEKIGELLDKFQANDPDGHAATLKGLSIGLGQLERLTTDTKTKIDDAVVGALEAAVKANAEKHGVELPK